MSQVKPIRQEGFPLLVGGSAILFCFGLQRLGHGPPTSGEQSALVSLLFQLLISPKIIPTDTHKIMFNRLSGLTGTVKLPHKFGWCSLLPSEFTLPPSFAPYLLFPCLQPSSVGRYFQCLTTDLAGLRH